MCVSCGIPEWRPSVSSSASVAAATSWAARAAFSALFRALPRESRLGGGARLATKTLNAAAPERLGEVALSLVLLSSVCVSIVLGAVDEDGVFPRIVRSLVKHEGNTK